MTYQLWEMISYGEGEQFHPLCLIAESTNFAELYDAFNKRMKQDIPCVIFVNTKLDNDSISDNITDSVIFESPNGGESIFERKFMDYDNRKKIK